MCYRKKDRYVLFPISKMTFVQRARMIVNFALERIPPTQYEIYFNICQSKTAFGWAFSLENEIECCLSFLHTHTHSLSGRGLFINH